MSMCISWLRRISRRDKAEARQCELKARDAPSGWLRDIPDSVVQKFVTVVMIDDKTLSLSGEELGSINEALVSSKAPNKLALSSQLEFHAKVKLCCCVFSVCSESPTRSTQRHAACRIVHVRPSFKSEVDFLSAAGALSFRFFEGGSLSSTWLFPETLKRSKATEDVLSHRKTRSKV